MLYQRARGGELLFSELQHVLHMDAKLVAKNSAMLLGVVSLLHACTCGTSRQVVPRIPDATRQPSYTEHAVMGYDVALDMLVLAGS